MLLHLFNVGLQLLSIEDAGRDRDTCNKNCFAWKCNERLQQKATELYKGTEFNEIAATEPTNEVVTAVISKHPEWQVALRPQVVRYGAQGVPTHPGTVQQLHCPRRQQPGAGLCLGRFPGADRTLDLRDSSAHRRQVARQIYSLTG